MFGLVFSGKAIFYTITPFIFITDFGWPAHYYILVMATFVLGLFLGNLTIQYYFKMREKDVIIFLAIFLCFLSGAGFLISAQLNFFNPYLALGLFFVYACGLEMLQVTVRGNISNLFPSILSSAVAFFSMVFSIFSIMLSTLAAHFLKADLLEIGILYTSITLLSGLFFCIYKIKKQ